VRSKNAFPSDAGPPSKEDQTEGIPEGSSLGDPKPPWRACVRQDTWRIGAFYKTILCGFGGNGRRFAFDFLTPIFAQFE
jgi:hypothetical protein